MKQPNLLTLWKNKGQILEGIKNSIFKREDVEAIAAERLAICELCTVYDADGKEGCMVSGTGPCCDQTKGGCGCSLGFKTRSLSSSCPLDPPKWEAVMSWEEENQLNQKLGL
jgi:hypothetical protein